MKIHRLTALATLVLAALLTITGLAAAQPGYGEGGPTVALSASASGDLITAVGSGFVPGEPVTATVFSEPMHLGTKNADRAGNVSFTFSVRGLAPGEHRVVLKAPSGSASATFIVTGGHPHEGVAKVSHKSSHSSSSSAGGHSYGGNSSSSSSSSGNSASGHSASGNSSSGNSYSGSGDSGNGGNGGDGELAYTGSDVIIPGAAVGLLLLVGGGAAVAASRRRRSETTNRS